MLLLWVLARGLVITVLTLPTVLALLGVLLMAAGLVWPLLVVDAWRLGVDPAMPTRARRRVAMLMVAGVLLTSVPVLGAGRRVWAAGDLIGSVFASDRTSAAERGRLECPSVRAACAQGRSVPPAPLSRPPRSSATPNARHS